MSTEGVSNTASTDATRQPAADTSTSSSQLSPAAQKALDDSKQLGVVNAEVLARNLAQNEPATAQELAEELAPTLEPQDRQRFDKELQGLGVNPAAASPAAAAGPSNAELALDLTQMALDITGIVDPTPISDGSNAVISAFRGDWKGALISAAGILPLVGDLAKLGKLGRYGELIGKVVDRARVDPAFAKLVEPTLEKIAAAIDKIPLDKLPASAREAIESIKGKLASRVDNAVPPARPSWRQTEIDATKNIPGMREQVSFKNGKEVPYGTPGSVRPDGYKPGMSMEAKNYKVDTAAGRTRLEENVAKQAIDRATHLPPGTTQKLTIDVRGQSVSRADVKAMLQNIETKSNGAILAKDINVLW